MPCRFPGPHPGGGKFRGIWPGGSPGLHPRGKLRGICPEGILQAHTRGEGSAPGGVPGLGGSAPGGGVEPSPLERLLLQAVRILLECILVLMLRMNRTIKTVLEVFTKSPQY